jgi:hypothetical protein
MSIFSAETLLIFGLIFEAILIIAGAVLTTSPQIRKTKNWNVLNTDGDWSAGGSVNSCDYCNPVNYFLGPGSWLQLPFGPAGGHATPAYEHPFWYFASPPFG